VLNELKDFELLKNSSSYGERSMDSFDLTLRKVGNLAAVESMIFSIESNILDVMLILDVEFFSDLFSFVLEDV
jgi:hypothetical protein